MNIYIGSMENFAQHQALHPKLPYSDTTLHVDSGTISGTKAIFNANLINDY